MSEFLRFVYDKVNQKSRETTREMWRSEGELILKSNSRNTTWLVDPFT